MGCVPDRCQSDSLPACAFEPCFENSHSKNQQSSSPPAAPRSRCCAAPPQCHILTQSLEPSPRLLSRLYLRALQPLGNCGTNFGQAPGSAIGSRSECPAGLRAAALQAETCLAAFCPLDGASRLARRQSGNCSFGTASKASAGSGCGSRTNSRFAECSGCELVHDRY